jgi:hypothetical protein
VFGRFQFFTALTSNPVIWLFILFMLEWILQLLMFGGHGTGGWLSRYDIYYNDCVVLDRGEMAGLCLPIPFLFLEPLNYFVVVTC